MTDNDIQLTLIISNLRDMSVEQYVYFQAAATLKDCISISTECKPPKHIST